MRFSLMMKNVSLKEHIENWINEVSTIRPEIGGFSICPFAKKSSYTIIECDVKNIYLPEKEYDVIIYKIEDHLFFKEIQEWVNYYNIMYKNWKFFKDCASYDTYINNIRTNNGKYNLILCQSKEKLKKYRKILSKTEYYHHWNLNYLKEILDDDYNDIFGIGTP